MSGSQAVIYGYQILSSNIHTNLHCNRSNSYISRYPTKKKNQPVLFLLRFPTCAWNPLLMALTDLLLPHDSQAIKKIRFSFVRRVSGDLQVLQVTYSTVCCFIVGGKRGGNNGLDWGRERMTLKLTHVAPKYVFNLFLLETTFDNETSCTVDTSCCTHFGEEELDNVFGLQRWEVYRISQPFPEKKIPREKIQNWRLWQWS